MTENEADQIRGAAGGYAADPTLPPDARTAFYGLSRTGTEQLTSGLLQLFGSLADALRRLYTPPPVPPGPPPPPPQPTLPGPKAGDTLHGGAAVFGGQAADTLGGLHGQPTLQAGGWRGTFAVADAVQADSILSLYAEERWTRDVRQPDGTTIRETHSIRVPRRPEECE